MNRSIPNRKCVVFCLLSIALGVVAAFAGTKAEVSKPDVGEAVKLQQRARAAAKERRAEETYEKRDTKIAPWVEATSPLNPDNAAVLYYQAFLLRPALDLTTSQKIDDVLRGAESDRQIRIYLGHCLPMIEVAEIACRIPQCTWGVRHQRGLGFSEKGLRSAVWDLSRILLVDARTLAADGHYRAALERCLTVRRFARHLSEDSELDLMARNPDLMALRTVRHVLGVMPPDANVLAWLRGQLAVVQGLRLSFAEMLQENYKSFFDLMRTNPTTLARLKNLLVEGAGDQQAKESAQNLTDGQLLSRAREPFPCFLDSIFRIVDSEMPYEQKLAQMQRLYKKLKEEDGTDMVVKYVIILSGTQGMIDRQYPFLVGHAAHINGVKAAVEVYLVLSKTGQLPKELPEHLPKDPFTGRDFVYATTDEGFALRCQGKDFQGRGKQRLEFKVRK